MVSVVIQMPHVYCSLFLPCHVLLWCVLGLLYPGLTGLPIKLYNNCTSTASHCVVPWVVTVSVAGEVVTNHSVGLCVLREEEEEDPLLIRLADMVEGFVVCCPHGLYRTQALH